MLRRWLSLEREEAELSDATPAELAVELRRWLPLPDATLSRAAMAMCGGVNTSLRQAMMASPRSGTADASPTALDTCDSKERRRPALPCVGAASISAVNLCPVEREREREGAKRHNTHGELAYVFVLCDACLATPPCIPAVSMECRSLSRSSAFTTRATISVNSHRSSNLRRTERRTLSTVARRCASRRASRCWSAGLLGSNRNVSTACVVVNQHRERV